MRRFAVLAMFALAASTAARAAAATPEPPDSLALGRALDACVAPLARSGELSGQLLLARGDTVLVERTWGWEDREHRRPMGVHSRLNIASITKPVNQLVLLKLLVDHTLAIDDTIGRWLPGYPHGGVTVGQLLNHRAGIPHRVTTDAQERHALSAAQVTALAGRVPLEFTPGSESRYSSAGYTVLAHVMEVAAGKAWAALVRSIVLDPAHLAETVPNAGLADPLPGRAQSYVPGARGLQPAMRKDYGFLAGAGSMWSTARDLFRFVRALLAGVFGENGRANLLRHGSLHWNGSTNGYFSWVDYDSASRVTCVFLGNAHTGAPELLHGAVAKLVAGEPVAPLERPAFMRVRVPSRALRALEGRYQIAGTRIPVTTRDGLLWAGEWMLVPTSESTFFSTRDYGTVRVARDSTGAVAGLDWTQKGQPFRCPRLGPLGASRTR